MSRHPLKDPEPAARDRQNLGLEQLLTVTRRLGGAIAADIQALERGAFGELKTTDPEIERLCAFYGREVKALKADGGIKHAPAQLVAALKESGAKLNGLLKIHERLVAAMRPAAEGLGQAGGERARK